MQPSVELATGRRRDRWSVRQPAARRVLIGGLLGVIVVTAVMCVVATAAARVFMATGTACSGDCSVRVADTRASTAELVRQVNRLRLRAGCRAVVPDAALQRAAQAYVEVVGRVAGVAHVDGVGGTAQDRARRQGYRGNVIELVAQGAVQPDDFIAALLPMVNQSDLLDCRFRAAGVAVAGRHLVLVVGDR